MLRGRIFSGEGICVAAVESPPAASPALFSQRRFSFPMINLSLSGGSQSAKLQAVGFTFARQKIYRREGL